MEDEAKKKKKKRKKKTCVESMLKSGCQHNERTPPLLSLSSSVVASC